MKMRCFKMLGYGLVAVLGFGAVVMLLWNALLPHLFGTAAINFWQALGILVLARILFGGFGGHHGRRHHGSRFHGDNQVREKWMKMTKEERAEFMKSHHGHHAHGGFFGHGSCHCDKKNGNDQETEINEQQ